MSDIQKLIKKLAGTDKDDKNRYCVGKVIGINHETYTQFENDKVYYSTTQNFLPSNTAQVKLISSTSIDGSAGIKFEKNDASGNTISQKIKDAIIEQYNNGLVLNRVSISVDGSVETTHNIPKINSNVIVCMANNQHPYISQFSEISNSVESYGTAKFFKGRSVNGNENGFYWFLKTDVNFQNYLGFFPNNTAQRNTFLDINVNNILLNTGGGDTPIDNRKNIIHMISDGTSNFIDIKSENSELQLNNTFTKLSNNNKKIEINTDLIEINPGNTGGKISITNGTENLAYILTDAITIISLSVSTAFGSPLVLLSPYLSADGYTIYPPGPITTTLALLMTRLSLLIV